MNTKTKVFLTKVLLWGLSGGLAGYLLSQSALKWLGGIIFAVFLVVAFFAWLDDQMALGRNGLERVLVCLFYFSVFFACSMSMSHVAPTLDDPQAMYAVKNKVFGWLLRK